VAKIIEKWLKNPAKAVLEMIKFPLQKHKIGFTTKFLFEKLTTKWLNVNSPE
jgi:hypothetical protein